MEDVSILVRVLKHGVAEVIVESPAGWGDDFVVAVEGRIGGDEVQEGLIRDAGDIVLTGVTNFDADGGAKAGAAVGEGDEARGQLR